MTTSDQPALSGEIIESDPFREYVLSARQYWVWVYEESKAIDPTMTLQEFLDRNWQNRDYRYTE